MKHVCEACQAKFDGTPDEAFTAGWDTPERFVSHCTCPNCTIDKTVWWKVVVERQEPTTEDIMLLASYNAAHANANIRPA